MLKSKTFIGLLVFLAAGLGLAFAGKLTVEAVDFLKYLGGSFFTVRAVANYAEGKAAK